MPGGALPNLEKPSREWWRTWEDWMRQRVSDSDLGWEAEADLVERFSAALLRLKQNGGLPKVQYGLRSFSIPHRYTRGGILPERLSSERAERLHLDLPPSTVYLKNDRASRRRRVVDASFLVGKTKVKLTVVMHRELPSKAIVKGVRLVGRRQSPTMDWETYLAITAEIPFVPPKIPEAGSVIGIDVGWRALKDRIRVAVAYDGLRHHELFMPLSLLHKRLGEVSLRRQRSLPATVRRRVPTLQVRTQRAWFARSK